MITESKLAIKDLRISRKRFWRLYMNELVFVEDQDAKLSVEKFATQLVAYEDPSRQNDVPNITAQYLEIK